MKSVKGFRSEAFTTRLSLLEFLDGGKRYFSELLR